MAHKHKLLLLLLCKNLGNISCTSRVIANSVSNFVAVATEISLGQIQKKTEKERAASRQEKG